MFRPKFLIAGLVAAAISLIAVERSEAQLRFSIGGGSSRVGVSIGRPWYGGYGYYGRPYYRGYYQPYGWGYNPYYYDYGWYAPNTAYYPPVTTYPPAYVAPNFPPAADNSATIEVHLPVNAALWFDGNQTTQTGPVRYFVTPPLVAGNASSYEVRASWMDDKGAPVTESRMVQVQPGQRSVVNLMK